LVDYLQGVFQVSIRRGCDTLQFQKSAYLYKARENLDIAKADAAKSLGHVLCQCTFPPQIMLWSETCKAHVCPNFDCVRTEGKEPARPRAEGAPCPKCGAYEFRTDKVTNDTGHFAELGAFNRHMKCGECGHTERIMETGQ
jgi:predicted nucleic-acid-binding Zn-ribbon protein